MPYFSVLDSAYLWVFRRQKFKALNERVLYLALRSLGILNWQNRVISGEAYFIDRVAQMGRRRDHFTALDVGGHRGQFSRLLLSAIPNSRIFSFEPNPKSFKRLCENIPESSTFHPTNVAVGDVDGHATLYDHAGRQGTGHASLIKGVIENIHGDVAQSYEVRQISLDSFLLSNDDIKSVDLLKIDVEGAEFKVLRGCSNALSQGRFAIIQFEFNEMNISSRVFFSDFAELLKGYKLYRLLPKGMIRLSLHRYQHYVREVFAFQNIVAILSGSVYDSREITGSEE